ncbi:hypothetical protein [Haladaptatus caseinilyticus]|uniref:hypothetical protein n=1 Tax=Haladaptatus caseinilyticus TaxID=2993314 RepID=UPI00224B1E58|nr:hypothetical protein [Haladaptatus caseinilyticus]
MEKTDANVGVTTTVGAAVTDVVPQAISTKDGTWFPAVDIDGFSRRSLAYELAATFSAALRSLQATSDPPRPHDA